jgi:FkbM family methyltransferase
MHLLLRLRGVDATFVDCGANYGYWSVVATGPDIKFRYAVAIEPNPKTFIRLQANARINGGRFACMERAIFNEAGKRVTLAGAEHHIVAHVDKGSGVGVQVQTTTIDVALAEMGWQANDHIITKLDVEGSELEAISGARATFERHDHLMIIEDWPETRFEALREVLSRGYQVFYMDSHGSCRRVDSAEKADLVSRVAARYAHGRNFVATRPGGEFHTRMEAWVAAST